MPVCSAHELNASSQRDCLSVSSAYLWFLTQCSIHAGSWGTPSLRSDASATNFHSVPPGTLAALPAEARQGQTLLGCSSFSPAGEEFCPFAALETNIPQHINPKWWRKKSCYKKVHDLSKSQVWSRVTALQVPVTERSSWQNHPTSMGFGSTSSEG